MNGGLKFPYEHLILDACCVTNLCVSHKMEAILEALPTPVFIAEYVHEKELLNIDKEGMLSSLISSGHLSRVSLDSESEENAFVNLAVYMDDEEAMTAAIALCRYWAIGTDDKGAISLFRRHDLKIPVVSTLDMVKYWIDAFSVPFDSAQETLSNMNRLGNYEPGRNHHLYEWWRGYFGGK